MTNGVMFQTFEWEMDSTGEFYNELASLAPELAKRGIDAVWLPPVFKATSEWDVGYGIYDLYDLGEFDKNAQNNQNTYNVSNSSNADSTNSAEDTDTQNTDTQTTDNSNNVDNPQTTDDTDIQTAQTTQTATKNQIRTKYGTKEELKKLIDVLHENNILVYMDVVLNHKAGADFTETFLATPVDPNDRTKSIGDPREIEGWTGFNFPGRGEKYSAFKWNYNHFSGVDFDQKTGETGIFRIEGENKGWGFGVSHEKGNFDYLMFADIDHANQEVRDELFTWVDWFIQETGCDGFRFDAVKHIDDHFMNDFSGHIVDKQGKKFYLFGEYWSPDLEHAGEYLSEVRFNMDVFDVGLHYHFQAASQNSDFDLRKLFDYTLVKDFPLNAVTFVDNHDSQPGQSLESWVGRHFKERAYATILLRVDGYPCIFAGDYYGIKRGDYPQEDIQYDINRLLEVRLNYAWGEQVDFFTSPQAIGWIRKGNQEHPGLLAVVMTMKEEASVHLNFGSEHAGKRFRDYLDRFKQAIKLDENGEADFPAQAGSVSCWVTSLTQDKQDEQTKLLRVSDRQKEEKLEG